jgi:hypothetical protein
MRESWLGYVQFLRRPGEMRILSDRQKIPEMTELDQSQTHRWCLWIK